MPLSRHKLKRPASPKEDLDALEFNLVRAEEIAAQNLQEIGYQRDILRAIRPYWQNTGIVSQQIPVSSGGAVLHNWRLQSETLLEAQDSWTRQVTGMSGTATYAADTTYTLALMYPTSPRFDARTIDDVKIRRTRQEVVEQQLRGIDDSLGDAYATVWQYIHFPALDKARGPLYQMRQVFDHLLDKLAPDTKVQAQDGFEPDVALKAKNGVGITRNHRIGYILDSKVPDAEVRQNLLSTAKSFADIYSSLNTAHNRKKLDEEAAKRAIYAGDDLLANWLKALNS